MEERGSALHNEERALVVDMLDGMGARSFGRDTLLDILQDKNENHCKMRLFARFLI